MSAQLRLPSESRQEQLEARLQLLAPRCETDAHLDTLLETGSLRIHHPVGGQGYITRLELDNVANLLPWGHLMSAPQDGRAFSECQHCQTAEPLLQVLFVKSSPSSAGDWMMAARRGRQTLT